MSVPEQGFGKEKRLRRKQDIDALFADAFRVSCGGLTARYAKNTVHVNRIAIANGRRWGNAVERNRVRRIAREAFRVWPGNKAAGSVDIVITQYRVLRDVPGKEIAHRFRRLFEQIT